MYFRAFEEITGGFRWYFREIQKIFSGFRRRYRNVIGVSEVLALHGPRRFQGVFGTISWKFQRIFSGFWRRIGKFRRLSEALQGV